MCSFLVLTMKNTTNIVLNWRNSMHLITLKWSIFLFSLLNISFPIFFSIDWEFYHFYVKWFKNRFIAYIIGLSFLNRLKNPIIFLLWAVTFVDFIVDFIDFIFILFLSIEFLLIFFWNCILSNRKMVFNIIEEILRISIKNSKENYILAEWMHKKFIHLKKHIEQIKMISTHDSKKKARLIPNKWKKSKTFETKWVQLNIAIWMIQKGLNINPWSGWIEWEYTNKKGSP